MPVDPAIPQPQGFEARLLARIAQLERQVRGLTALVNGGAVGQIPVVDALPTAGRKGRLVFLTTDGKVYKDTGSSWANPL